VAEGGGNGGRNGGRNGGETMGGQGSSRGLYAVSTAVSYFPELSKAAQTWKFKMDAVPYSTNCQFFHVARFTHYEQFSQLCRHLILNRIRVKNPRTDSTFESLKNFKRDLNLLKNLINSPKFLLDLIFTKVNLVGITCMQDIELQYKCQMAWFE
jgi:hypothetical protein